MGQQQQTGFNLATNWIIIVEIVIIVVLLANPFFADPLPGTAEIKRITTLTAPFFGPLGAVLLFRYQWRIWREKRGGWRVAPLYMASFVLTLVLIWTLGTGHKLYSDLYEIFVNNAGGMILATQAVTYSAAYLMLTPRSYMVIEIMIFTVLGLLGGTPLLYMISPDLLTFVEWMVGQNIASVEVVYTSYYNSVIGLTSMFIILTGVFTLREDLKPR
jgi:hypothetical protein